jgi:Sulfite exporter TauE/SafE
MTPLDPRTGLVAQIRRCRLDSRTMVLGVAGAAAGILCGLLGVAGGVVIVPVLASRRIGMARATASGTTIAAVLPISVVAAVTYAGLHNVDEPAASAIVPGAAAGMIVGSLLATRVRAPVLRSLFHLVLLATAVRLLIALPSGGIHQIAVEVPAAVTLCALGAVAGLASGMLGSGGGTFLVPALVVAFGLVQQAERPPTARRRIGSEQARPETSSLSVIRPGRPECARSARFGGPTPVWRLVWRHAPNGYAGHSSSRDTVYASTTKRGL